MTARMYVDGDLGEPSFYVNASTGAPADLFAVVNLDGIRGRYRLTSGQPEDLRLIAQVILDAADELERKQIALGGLDA
jgi:hypothetical protein